MLFTQPRYHARFGQNLMEYSLVAGLLALVCIGGLQMLGGGLNTGFSAMVSSPAAVKGAKVDAVSVVSDGSAIVSDQGKRVNLNSQSQALLDQYQSITQTAGSLGDEKRLFTYADQMVAMASKYAETDPALFNEIVALGIQGKQMARLITETQDHVKDLSVLNASVNAYGDAGYRVQATPEFKRLSQEDQTIVKNLWNVSWSLGSAVRTYGNSDNANVKVDQNSNQVVVCGQNMKCNN